MISHVGVRPAFAPPPPGWRPSLSARVDIGRALARGHLSDPDAEAYGPPLRVAIAARLGVDAGAVHPFASGSGALLACLLCAGAASGREVLLSPLGPAYVAGTVALSGARPVAVELEPVRLDLDPAALAARLGPRTAAVLWTPPPGAGPDHLRAIGQAAQAAGTVLIEDAAHLLGAVDADGRPYGTRADLGVFSLSYGKALGVGEGGLAVVPGRVHRRTLHRLAGSAGGSLPRLAALGRLPVLTAALAVASLGELDGRAARRLALSGRLGHEADARGAASRPGLGIPLWVGRFPTARAAARADRAAEAARLELAAPALWTGAGKDLAVAREAASHLRILPWWDAGGARQAEAQALIDAWIGVLEAAT